MNIAILGTGFIARFYADALQSQRRKDVVRVAYSRNEARAKKFADDYQLPHYFTDLNKAVSHPETDVVVIALPNNLHEEAVMACVKAKKACALHQTIGQDSRRS